MTVDEIPGLSFALALPGERVELHVRLLDDSTIDLITVIPEITAALCVKVLGYADRLAAKDALDVWRLLAAYRMRVPAPLPWARLRPGVRRRGAGRRELTGGTSPDSRSGIACAWPIAARVAAPAGAASGSRS